MTDAMNEMIGYAGASRVTGIKLSTLSSYVSRKIIPHYRLGRRLVVFAVPEIQEWMKERRGRRGREPAMKLLGGLRAIAGGGRGEEPRT